MKVIKIPADTQQPITLIDVNGWEGMAAAIGGSCQYVEKVNCTLTPDSGLVMVVDEMGLHHQDQLPNPRAQNLYPFSDIVGNVLVAAMGYTAEGVDFVDIPSTKHAMRLVEVAVSV